LFFYLEITTGLRRGELCGLMWSDFDEKKGTISIRRTLHSKTGGGYYVSDTKTATGRRNIKLPPSTVQLLKERKKKSITQWIFANPIHPEDPVMPNSGYHRMKKLLKRAGLPNLRFHDLRHTFATHALTSGVDAKTLSGILGHTKTSFTLDTYTHVTGDMHRRASITRPVFWKRRIITSPRSPQSLGMRIPCISAVCSKSRKESLPLTTESSCMTIPLRYRKQTSLPCCIVPQTKGQYHYKTQPLRDENYCLSLNGCSIFLWSCLPIQIFVYRLQM